MRVRNLLHVAQLALFTFLLPDVSVAAKPAFCFVNPENHVCMLQNAPDPEEECPAVTGIGAEFYDDGTALITWDPALNIQQYTITITDQNGAVLINTDIDGNEFVASGFEYGIEYTITVCYVCPFTGETICAERRVRYVIIEDLVVMLDGGNCGCNTPHGVSGPCTASGGFNQYDLSASKIYKVVLQTGEQISFTYSGGHIRRVGSCPNNYSGHNTETHGSTPYVEYIKLTNSKIYFHNNHFCIESALVSSVKACNIYGPVYVLYPPLVNYDPDIVPASAYPNPFNDVLNIEIPGSDTDNNTAYVQLFDTRGQLVYEEILSDLPPDTSTAQINVAGLEPGVYWLMVLRDGQLPMAVRVVKIE